MMHRSVFRLVSLLTIPFAFLSSSVHAAPPMSSAYIPMPATNMPNNGWVAGDTTLVYVGDDPLIGPRNNPNTGHYFKDFHAQVFTARLKVRNQRLVVGPLRLLFRGPLGKRIGPGAVLGGWFVYEQYDAYNIGGNWTILARNLVTGKTLSIDSRDQEGVPSLTPIPQSDGQSVAWESWTKVHGRTTSVIRTYDLTTGQRRLILEGGSPNTWAYTGVRISGRYLVVEKDLYNKQRAQILLVDRITGTVRALTPATGANSEPSISGNLVVWKFGWRFGAGNGVVVDNLQTGKRTRIPGVKAEVPQVVATHYVVFPQGYTTRIRLFDDRAGSLQTLAPADDGYSSVGDVANASGHVVLYDEGRPCGSPTFTCPGRLVITWVRG